MSRSTTPLPSALIEEPMRQPPVVGEQRFVEARLNRVLDHIDAHVAAPLELESLAALAAYSPFHFLRVFRSKFGETPYDFVRRRRIELAAGRLRLAADEPIEQVALATGFASGETLARAFRQTYGMSAGAWKRGGWREWTERPATDGRPPYGPVAVLRQPRRLLLYRRVRGDYGLTVPPTWASFVPWVHSMGLQPTGWLGNGLDDPALTVAEQCRYDVCAIVPDEQAELARQAMRSAPAMVSLKEFVPGWYANMAYDGPIEQVPTAWRSLLEDWLPGSGFAMGTGQFSDHFESSDGIPGLREDGRQVSRLMMPVRATTHGR